MLPDSTSTHGKHSAPDHHCVRAVQNVPCTQQRRSNNRHVLPTKKDPLNEPLPSDLGYQTHPHWCTVCENPSPLYTCDGWKRHEKEQHEKGYVCMPNGPVEFTENGPCCAFCGLIHPDQRHLELHGTSLCVDKSWKDRRYTRKFQLVRHLETHGVHDGTNLADSWRVILKNKYYSCGLCVTLFLSNADRLNHIDTSHFRHHQTIHEWNPNLVIRGLLLQPAVLQCWKERSTCDLMSTNLIWEPHVIAKLQSRLEVADDPPEQLAEDALYQSSIAGIGPPMISSSNTTLDDWQHHAHATAIPTGDGQQMPLHDTQSDPNFCLDITDHSLGCERHYRMQPSRVVDGTGGFDYTGIHPPQNVPNVFREATATGYPIYEGLVLPAQPNTLLDTFYMQSPEDIADPDSGVESSFVHHSEPSSQRASSAFDSWRSSSLASTNTSIHSLSTVMQNYPQFTPDSRRNHQPSVALVMPSPSSSAQNAPTCTNSLNHRKSASIVAHLKRRLTRVKVKDAGTDVETQMDIDMDDLMRSMEDDEQSKTQIGSRHEVSA